MFPAGWSSEFVFWWTNTQFPGEARRRSAHSGSSLPFKLRRKSPCQRSVSDSGRPRGLDLDAGGEASSRAAAPNLGRLQKHSHAVTTQPLGINWTGLTLLLPPLRLLHWFLKIIGANWLLDAAVGNTLCSVRGRCRWKYAQAMDYRTSYSFTVSIVQGAGFLCFVFSRSDM